MRYGLLPCPAERGEDLENHHRQSIRLKGYDDTQGGAYFVTICTQNRACLFGNITDGKIQINDTGRMIEQCWKDIPCHFQNMGVDTFTVMPNHLHGIIVITDGVGAGLPRPYNTPCTSRTTTLPIHGKRPTLGQIIAHFKYKTTKQINNIHDTPNKKLWQRNYYEHVIRNEESLNQIRQYILDNPIQWDIDQENPAYNINTSPRKKIL